jgi:FtsH-binding integral membrane protein
VTEGSRPDTDRRSKLFWPLAIIGWAIMVYALRGIFMHERDTHPFQLFRLVVGLDLVHDLVLAPIVIAVGYGLTRLVPARARPPVTAALFVSAAVALYAYPLVRGYGRFAEFNSSRLPNNYATGLIVVLAAIWVVAAVLVGIRLRRP